MPLPPCPDAEILHLNASGDPEATPPGFAVARQMDDTFCYARVDCPAFGLPIRTADGGYSHIERIEPGGRVKACGLDLAWADRPAAFCDGLPSIPEDRTGVLLGFLDSAIVLSADDILLLADGSLSRAGQLAPDDALMGVSANSVAIQALHTGQYLSGFYRLATQAEQPDAALTGHLLDANGVVLGDYAVQVFARIGALDALFSPAKSAAPEIGSPAYLERNGSACLAPPDLGGPDISLCVGPWAEAEAAPGA